jgi:hypothetical protein
VIGVKPEDRAVYHHPETTLQFAKEHQSELRRQANDDRFVREATSIARQEPRERFKVRDLRWILFRPVGV